MTVISKLKLQSDSYNHPTHRQAHKQTGTQHLATSRSTRLLYFLGKLLGNSLAGPKRVWGVEGEDTDLGWSEEPGKAMERAAAPGLTFTLQSGMTKPRLVPAEPGLQAQLCAGGRRISHPSSPLVTELRKLCWGVGGQSLAQLSGLCESSAAFPPLSSFPSEDDCSP